jgi:hypothetical protein
MTNVRIPKPMYALGLAKKSLGMLIAKGYSCSWCLGVNSVADTIIYKDLLGDKFGKGLIARVAVADDCYGLLDRTTLFSRTTPCK